MQEFQEPAGRPLESQDIWHYLRVFRRRWWLIAMAGALGLGTAWLSERGRPDQYTAEVLVQHSSQEPIVSTMLGAGRVADFGSHLDMIRTPAVLGPVVDSLGLQLKIRNRPEAWSRFVGRFEAARDVAGGVYTLKLEQGEQHLLDRDEEILATAPIGDPISGPGFTLQVADPGVLDREVEFNVFDADFAIEGLLNQLKIEPGSGIDLISISYSNPDPKLAANVVNSVAFAYQRHRADMARAATSRRREVIAAELVDLADSLRAVRDRVLQYQERVQLTDPESESSTMLGRLYQFENDLQELRFQESLLSGLLVGLETEGQTEASLQQIVAAGGGLVPSGNALGTRLQELELERSRLTASRFGLTENSPEVQVVDSLIAATKQQIRVAGEQGLDLVRSQIASTQRRYNELRAQVGAMPARTAEYGRLQQRAEVVQGAFDRLVDKFFEAQIAEGVEAGDIDVVGIAPVPVRPDPSRRGFKMMLALVAGALVGMVGVIALDQLDSSLRVPGDVESLSGLHVLGVVPTVRGDGGQSISVQMGKEAFRTLRTHLRFLGPSQPRILAVTSPTPRDGKSTVASNLALTYVEQGVSTLLIDADLRRPQIHTTFEVPLQPGLSDVLQGDAGLEHAVKTPPTGGLSILPAGTQVPNPTELIGADAFRLLLDKLSETYQVIVVDTPPVLAVSDAALIGVLADGALLVVRANKTDQEAFSSAVGQLQRLRVNLFGVVMNGTPMRSRGSSYYPSYYQYETYEAQSDTEKRPLLKPSRRA